MGPGEGPGPGLRGPDPGLGGPILDWVGSNPDWVGPGLDWRNAGLARGDLGLAGEEPAPPIGNSSYAPSQFPGFPALPPCDRLQAHLRQMIGDDWRRPYPRVAPTPGRTPGMETTEDRNKYIRHMRSALRVGRTFDLILVVAGSRGQGERVGRHFSRLQEETAVFRALPIEVVSLDELGRPWRGGNFDASVFAIQRVRRMLTQQGVDEEKARSLIVLAAGSGTRAYPITAVEGGNKALIYTPSQEDGVPLRMVDFVIAQYHQILDEMEPGRIHLAACDHALGWVRKPQAPGRQPVQIFASRVSFARELRLTGLVDGNLAPQWESRAELQGRLQDLNMGRLLPVLTSLTQLGLVNVDRGPEKNLLRMVEKADPATIIEEFIGCGAAAWVNWWDWSVSSGAARVLVNEYADLLGSGIDLSMDVLEPATMSQDDWLRRRPDRSPELWDRAHGLFADAVTPRAAPLGRIGVADSGDGSLFADMGTLEALYDTYSRGLQEDEEGEALRALFNARLDGGSLIVGAPPGGRVIVEPGAIVINGKGIRSGRIGSGSIVVSTEVAKLVTSGRNIVYGVKAPSRSLAVEEGEVIVGVRRRGRTELVQGRVFELSTGGPDRAGWHRPRYGNAMSFADLHADIMAVKQHPEQAIHRGDWNGRPTEADQTKSPRALRGSRRRPRARPGRLAGSREGHQGSVGHGYLAPFQEDENGIRGEVDDSRGLSGEGAEGEGIAADGNSPQ
jgi:hypothetical protein